MLWTVLRYRAEAAGGWEGEAARGRPKTSQKEGTRTGAGGGRESTRGAGICLWCICPRLGVLGSRCSGRPVGLM